MLARGRPSASVKNRAGAVGVGGAHSAQDCSTEIGEPARTPVASIDPLQVCDGYYLQVDGPVAAKSSKLLRMALGRSAKVAMATNAWTGRESLGLLRVRDNVMVLHAMRWPDEIHSPKGVSPAWWNCSRTR